jgi:hypothetical protein
MCLYLLNLWLCVCVCVCVCACICMSMLFICYTAVDVFACSYANLSVSIGAQGCCRQLLIWLLWLPLLVCVWAGGCVCLSGCVNDREVE